ncbi:MAG: VanZ family protein [Nitrospira sp.]|nr:VanZ family protein [Nitrospira sp.]
MGILPLHNFVGHAHWQYIRWVPTPDQLSSPAILLDLGVDAVANILLFVPFGLLYALRGLEGKPLSLRHLVLIAFALSFSIEYYQVYCHNRSTSLLDLLDNVLGAYLGMKVGEVYVRRSLATVVEPAA